MKRIEQYPVTLGYNSTEPPYSPSRPHKGIDYALSVGTPVIICDTQIGLAGDTGLAFGPHVHVQAGRDEWAQQPINPSSYVGKPGIVVKTGFASEWGNYVCVRVRDVNVFYCHLSKVQVTLGKVITGGVMVDKVIMDVFWRCYYGTKPTDAECAKFIDKVTPSELRRRIIASARYKDLEDKAAQGKLNPVNHLPGALKAFYKPADAKVLSSGNYVVE